MILNLFFPKKCLQCGVVGVYICDSCLKKVSPGRLVQNHYSIFKYEGVIRKAILALKYKYATDIVHELSKICATKLKRQKIIKSKSITLVPIPLHKKREKQRGFNQVGLIGKEISKQMNWKYMPDLLVRSKPTTPQASLKGSARQTNLTGAFKFNPKHTKNTTHNILLFDDVYTTGSTLKEALKVLREEGYKNIKTLAVAR